MNGENTESEVNTGNGMSYFCVVMNKYYWQYGCRYQEPGMRSSLKRKPEFTMKSFCLSWGEMRRTRRCINDEVLFHPR